ncbi:MAG: hypothetical protein QOC77_1887 [Thermoleophilaceae bacterium]|nr:hypothetical protein [Thermoleophilaceae bacterium]MEA2471872.1 hypothetical protein [Thermoleophilaceae bacterium]
MTQTLESPAAAEAAPPPSRRRSVPTLPLLVLGCFVLAAISLTLPSVPTQDSWSWIVWGREVAHLDLSTTGGSSWKPLPVLFTTVYSIFGDHGAPSLWIMTSRAGGLLAILFAFRIAKRFGGWPAGIAAGVFMAGADWLRFMGNGNVEPLSAGLALAAVDRHLDGHPHQTIALGSLAALGRPELWPFVALYAAYMVFRRKQASLVIAAVLLALVPIGWLGGDWWGSGDPFHGSKLAAGFRDRQKQHREAALQRDKKRHVVVDRSTGVAVEHTLRGAKVLLIPPAFIAALVAIGFAIRRRERTPLVLAAGAIAMFCVIGGMALAGYGGSPRFLFPAAGFVAALGGIGIGQLVREAGRRWRPGAFIAAAAITAIIVPFAIDRGQEFSARAHEVNLRAKYEDQLDQAVALAGGRERVLSLGAPRSNSTYAHQLAWLLHIHQDQIAGPKPRNVVFSGRPTLVSPSRPPRLPTHGVKVTRVAATGIWTVLQVHKIP